MTDFLSKFIYFDHKKPRDYRFRPLGWWAEPSLPLFFAYGSSHYYLHVFNDFLSSNDVFFISHSEALMRLLTINSLFYSLLRSAPLFPVPVPKIRKKATTTTTETQNEDRQFLRKGKSRGQRRRRNAKHQKMRRFLEGRRLTATIGSFEFPFHFVAILLLTFAYTPDIEISRPTFSQASTEFPSIIWPLSVLETFFGCCNSNFDTKPQTAASLNEENGKSWMDQWKVYDHPQKLTFSLNKQFVGCVLWSGHKF